MMARTAGLNILGLVLGSWIARTSFTQSSKEVSDGRNKVHMYWLDGSSGIFYTPNYPNPYPAYAKCIWSISVPAGKIVNLKFEVFDLDPVSYGCRASTLERNYVLILDGRSSASKELALHCGYDTSIPSDVYSTGRYMMVEFWSAVVGVPRGFKAHFKAVDPNLQAASIARNQVRRLEGSSGTFNFTPNYPNPYPANAKFIWIISVPAGKIVKLKFEDFDLVGASYGCVASKGESNYVQILDGPSSASKELAMHCGDDRSIPSDVYSTGKYMWVEFWSRAGLRGFKAHFKAVDPDLFYSKESCFTWNIYNNNLNLNGSYGTLQSPQYPEYYPPGSSCDWLITVPKGMVVKLRFDNFKLRSYTYCGDYVEVLDGNSSFSKNKGRFNTYIRPSDRPNDIRSSGSYMWVRFRANTCRSREYHGVFKATFTAENKLISFQTPTPMATLKSPSDPGSVIWVVGAVIAVIVLIGIGCCSMYVSIRKKTRSRAAGGGMPMPSVSHATQPMRVQLPPLPSNRPLVQPAANSLTTPAVVYVPDGTDQSLPARGNPYPSEPPPPYCQANPYPSEPPPPYPGWASTHRLQGSL